MGGSLHHPQAATGLHALHRRDQFRPIEHGHKSMVCGCGCSNPSSAAANQTKSIVQSSRLILVLAAVNRRADARRVNEDCSDLWGTPIAKEGALIEPIEMAKQNEQAAFELEVNLAQTEANRTAKLAEQTRHRWAKEEPLYDGRQLARNRNDRTDKQTSRSRCLAAQSTIAEPRLFPTVLSVRGKPRLMERSIANFQVLCCADRARGPGLHRYRGAGR